MTFSAYYSVPGSAPSQSYPIIRGMPRLAIISSNRQRKVDGSRED